MIRGASWRTTTVQELRLAWESVDHGVHVSQFPDMPQLGAALMHSGLLEPVMDVERHRLQYPSVHALMRELQRIGARNAASDRSRGLTSRARLQRMIDPRATRGNLHPHGPITDGLDEALVVAQELPGSAD